MATQASTSQGLQLTRPSGLSAVGWLLPVVMLVPAVLMSAVAVHEIDRLYRADAGVVRAEQLVPYPLVLRHSDLGHDDPASSARFSAAHDRWQRMGERSADEVASTAWRESNGRLVVVVVTVSDDPRRVAASLQQRARGGEQARTWLEGERVAVALIVTPGAGDGATPSVLTDRERSIHRSVTLQRAASLTAGAVLPVIAIAILLGAAVVAAALIVLPLLLLYAGIAVVFLGRSPDLRARAQARTRRAEIGRPVELTPGVELVALKPWRLPSGSGFLRTVPLAVVALPAMTSSLWPGSLVWAGVLALVLVLAMKWAEGSLAARWLRRVLYVALVLGLLHALVSWPQSPIEDRRVLLALAAVAAATGLLALHRRRATQVQVGGGVLGLRWITFLVGFVVVAAASVALFLGSNGALDLSTQLRMKALALPGLVLVTLAARRLRAARAAALRVRLRHAGAPEVLYLRSFEDDRLRVRSERRARDGLERWLPWPFESFEDVLLRGFERVGPVVAIARPGTEQTELGAARDLVVGDDWVTAVQREMDTARFIMVVLGSGRGLHTELGLLCEGDRLERVCVVVPPVPAAEVAERLASGTGALAGGAGWGDLDGDIILGGGEVVALVGIGSRRLVMVAPRRRRASAYVSLAFTVAALLADAERTVDPSARDEQAEQAPQDGPDPLSSRRRSRRA